MSWCTRSIGMHFRESGAGRTSSMRGMHRLVWNGMRPRTEAAIGLGSLAAVLILGAAVGASRNHSEDEDPRASSYLPGPMGERGLADALQRLGVRVDRFRRRYRQLPANDS